jgi:carboxyl-terminal processing protease
MVGALKDPFTSYSPPQRASLRQEDLRGEFYGIGATLTPANPDGTGAKIEGVMKGLPAQRAGMRAGDVILEVDGEDVTALPSRRWWPASGDGRGPRSPSRCAGRACPPPWSLSSSGRRWRSSLSPVGKIGDVGYVALETFANFKVEDQLKKAIEGLKAQGVKKLIFDLRTTAAASWTRGAPWPAPF